MKKTLKPILVPTDKAENAFLLQYSKLRFQKGYFTQDYLQSENTRSFHLYAISDEKPKIGDWSINLNSSHSHKELCRIDNEIELERYVNKDGNDCKKVVITTDKFLVIRYDERYADVIISGKSLNGRLLTFTNDFINTYIERYNKGEILEYIEVKYNGVKCSNELCTGECIDCHNMYLPLKVNPDNTVDVSLIEDNSNQKQSIEFNEKIISKLY